MPKKFNLEITTKIVVSTPEPPDFLTTDSNIPVKLEDIPDSILVKIGEAYSARLLEKARAKRKAKKEQEEAIKKEASKDDLLDQLKRAMTDSKGITQAPIPQIPPQKIYPMYPEDPAYPGVKQKPWGTQEEMFYMIGDVKIPVKPSPQPFLFWDIDGPPGTDPLNTSNS